MSTTLPPIRRLVTEDDASGRSRIVEDQPATAVRTVEGRPNYLAVNIWRTEASPAPINAPDSIHHHTGILPPKNGGSILRIIDYPPEVRTRRSAGARSPLPSAASSPMPTTTSAPAPIPACTAPTRWTTPSSSKARFGR